MKPPCSFPPDSFCKCCSVAVAYFCRTNYPKAYDLTATVYGAPDAGSAGQLWCFVLHCLVSVRLPWQVSWWNRVSRDLTQYLAMSRLLVVNVGSGLGCLVLQEALLDFLLHVDAGFQEPESRSCRTKRPGLGLVSHHFCYSLPVKTKDKAGPGSEGGEIDATCWWKAVQNIMAILGVHHVFPHLRCSRAHLQGCLPSSALRPKQIKGPSHAIEGTHAG